jgi:hypothetical protein
MGKRFIIEGETTEKVLIGVELSATDTSLKLYIFKPKKGLNEKLENWKSGDGKLPAGSEKVKRTIADQNLLPEEIKVQDIGKVRFIENAWAEALIQTRLFQSFDTEILVLQESVAALEDYSEKLFQECSSFWKRVIEFKRENKGVDDSKIDSYKLQLDILFEVLKSLRKDHKKEFDSQSIDNKQKLSKMLQEVDHKLKENPNFKNAFNKLKEIRAEYIKSPMRHSHKDDIDKRINELFDKVSKVRKTNQHSNSDKRVTDLEGIVTKMNKALDWKIREMGKEEENLKFVAHEFQEKLIEGKIKLLQKDIKEIEGKITDIKGTLDKLKK